MREYTYLAGDWDHDGDVVKKIQKWNEDPFTTLRFKDAHKITQSRDESLNCSIKQSLATRMNESHTFVLVVGDNTLSVRAGSCGYCSSSFNNRCYRGYNFTNESFIDYECNKAYSDGLRVVVIYNSSTVDRNKCPLAVRQKGIHIPAYYFLSGKYYWNYEEVRKSIMGY